jgi:hypothetical protein
MSNPRWYSSRTRSLTVTGTTGNSFQKSWERTGAIVAEAIFASTIVETGISDALVEVDITGEISVTENDDTSTSGVFGI